MSRLQKYAEEQIEKERRCLRITKSALSYWQKTKEKWEIGELPNDSIRLEECNTGFDPSKLDDLIRKEIDAISYHEKEIEIWTNEIAGLV